LFIGSVPENTSKAHKKFGELLEEIKPNHKIFCEYSVKKLLLNYWDQNNVITCYREPSLLAAVRNLHFDFYDQTFGIIFEIQGSQHNDYNEFFHGTMGGFDVQRKNDNLKKRVSNITEIKLIEISSQEEITEDLIIGFYQL
jgi:hypothetical protein